MHVNFRGPYLNQGEVYNLNYFITSWVKIYLYSILQAAGSKSFLKWLIGEVYVKGTAIDGSLHMLAALHLG